MSGCFQNSGSVPERAMRATGRSGRRKETNTKRVMSSERANGRQIPEGGKGLKGLGTPAPSGTCLWAPTQTLHSDVYRRNARVATVDRGAASEGPSLAGNRQSRTTRCRGCLFAGRSSIDTDTRHTLFERAPVGKQPIHLGRDRGVGPREKSFGCVLDAKARYGR